MGYQYQPTNQQPRVNHKEIWLSKVCKVGLGHNLTSYDTMLGKHSSRTINDDNVSHTHKMKQTQDMVMSKDTVEST